MESLYEQIGRIQVELAWLEKTASCSTVEEKRRLIERDGELSIVRQCELLDINHAGIYLEPRGKAR